MGEAGASPGLSLICHADAPAELDSLNKELTRARERRVDVSEPSVPLSTRSYERARETTLQDLATVSDAHTLRLQAETFASQVCEGAAASRGSLEVQCSPVGPRLSLGF